MADHIKIKSVDESKTSFGFEVGGGGTFPIPTSVTEGGTGGGVDAKFLFSNNLNRSFFLNLEYLKLDTSGHLYTDTNAEGATINNTSQSGRIAWGKRKRSNILFNKNGNPWFATVSETIPYLGYGKATSSTPDKIVDGTTFSYPGEEDNYLEMGSRYGFGLEFKPKDRFQMTLMPHLSYGFRYSGEESKFNRISISAGINIYIGYGDLPESTNNDFTLLDFLYAGYAKCHSFGTRLTGDRVVNRSQDIVKEGIPGFADGGGDPDPAEDTKLLTGISSFMGSSGGAASQEAFMNAGDFRWLYLALELASGAASIGLGKTNSTKAAGTGDLLNGLGMLTYTAFGVDTKSKRTAKEAADKNLAYALATRFALNTAFLLGGIAAGDSDAGQIVRGAGGNANIAASMNPEPSGTVKSKTTYSYVPISWYKDSNQTGKRAGFLVHTELDTLPIYTEATFLSHAFTGENIGNRFQQDEHYTNVTLPTSVIGTLGVHWSIKYFSVGAGLDTAIIVGGNNADSGIGISAKIDVKLPIKEFGLSIGVRGSAHKTFPEGYDLEAFIPIGLQF